MLEAWEDRAAAWFQLASEDGMSCRGWELAIERPDGGSLSHRSCPWGGHLVRLDVRNVWVDGAPQTPSNVLVRPEVRSRFASLDSFRSETCSGFVETFAPGDALIKQGHTMPLLRLAALLFGDISVLHNFDGFMLRDVMGRQRLRRDFPEEGDCTYLFEDTYGHAQEYLLTVRPEGQGLFRGVCIFSAPMDTWYEWVSPFFPMLLNEVHSVLERYLNRPGIQELRLADEKFYLVLSLRNFNRGPPMIPQSTPDESTVTIQAGWDCGLPHWTPFAGTRQRFRLAEYLHRFLEKLGHAVPTYDTLDGRLLVPYQCIVVREQWIDLRTSFLAALKLQKMAYRFLRGGTTAPTLVEDVAPRIASMDNSVPWSSSSSKPVPRVLAKVVVRKTFLELEDDVQCPIETHGGPSWSLKRSKSASGEIYFDVQRCTASH